MIASSGQVEIGVLDSHFNKLCLFVELVRVRAYTLSPGIWTLLSDNYVAFFSIFLHGNIKQLASMEIFLAKFLHY